jgi:hypothetical protein
MLPFIHGGCGRAADGIRAEIEARYAEQWKNGTAAQRKLLRKRIKMEVRAAIKVKAPGYGLY